MILNEFNKITEQYDRPVPGMQDVENDNGQIHLGDLRKTKLTLRQINKMRQMNDIRAYEENEKLTKVRKQYAPAPEPTGGSF